MSLKIAVFYHCLFVHGNPPAFRPRAYEIVERQMNMMRDHGLLDATEFMLAGINGGKESEVYADQILPSKATKVYHGLDSKAENLTIVELEKWVPTHPDWYVLYFHAKGCTHLPDSTYGNTVSGPWREAMNQDVVANWRQCVEALDQGYESAGSHFMKGLADGTQNIWAGNFWWATSNFLQTVPSIFLRERIHVSGIAAAESRYEAEVWLGNAPRLPKVKEFRPNGGGGVP